MLWLVFRLNRLGLPLLQGQVNYENAALANLTIDRDGSTHQANKLPADGQAQPGAGSRLLTTLGLLEVPEQLVLIVARNAGARVLNFDQQKRFHWACAVGADAHADAA